MEEKNRNIKLFPIYKMISWDLLFFYAIIFLYLVQVKKLSAPQVILAEALYNVAIMLFIIPSGKIVDKIGKKIGAIRSHETDYEKVYTTVLKDLREGYLGRVTFDEYNKEI